MVTRESRAFYDFDPPYQRGSVWSTDQRRALMKSMLQGIPVPAIVTNDRFRLEFEGYSSNFDAKKPMYAIVDGKQRMEAVRAWVDDELDIPASWLEADQIESTHDTHDGPYVSRSELSVIGDRVVRQCMLIQVAEGKLNSIREEAALFRLLNGDGIAQSEADMARALAVENGE